MTTIAHANPTTEVAEKVEETVHRNGWVERVGRLGWLAKGFVYLLLSIVVLRVGFSGAFGRHESSEASPQGALEEVASQPFGRSVLLVLGAGLLLYTLWRVISALLPGEEGVHGLAKRAGYLFSAAMYGVLGAVAFDMGVSGRQESQDGTGTLLRGLMAHEWGRWLVGMVGVVALGSAAYFVYKGLTRKFEEQIDYTGMGKAHRAVVDGLGRVGWVARALVVALFGGFLTHAAVTYDVSNAQGLDGVFREAASTTTGSTLVIAAGAGLAVYAAFCLASWRRRILRGP